MAFYASAQQILSVALEVRAPTTNPSVRVQQTCVKATRPSGVRQAFPVVRASVEGRNGGHHGQTSPVRLIAAVVLKHGHRPTFRLGLAASRCRDVTPGLFGREVADAHVRIVRSPCSLLCCVTGGRQ